MAKLFPGSQTGIRRAPDPARTLAGGFALLIALGAALLSQPAATVDGQGLDLVDALFTATSAVCVTGLVVVDTGTHFTLLGQLVILALIQMGGLGFMTMSTLVALVLGKRIGLGERRLIQEQMNVPTMGGLVRLVKNVTVFTMAVQGLGVVVLAWHWAPHFGWPDNLFHAIFHSVSAFCNAGFDLQGSFASLTGWQGDPVVNLVTMSLIVVGGIGFAVVADLIAWPQRRQLALHTRVVLVVTGALIAAGAAGIAILEWGNPETLGALDWSDRLLNSAFHSITPRTAGFNTLDLPALGSPALVLTMLLMFVGGSSGSTAGGIKTTTFAVLVMGVVAYLRGDGEPVIFRRSIATNLVWKSLTIALLGMTLIFAGTMALLLTEDDQFLKTLFEATSAFGTVGLSLGLTTELSDPGRLVLTVLMFSGRLGPLTLALALGRRRLALRSVHHPPGRVAVG